MRKVNPFGRSLLTGDEAYHEEISPRACWCSPANAFATTKGKFDNCEHCGCTCNNSPIMRIGGRPTATDADRAS